MFAVATYTVDMNLERTMLLVACVAVIFFLGGWLFRRKKDKNPCYLEDLDSDPDKKYRVLYTLGWSPLIGLVQDKLGVEEPFLLFLPGDQQFHKYTIFVKIEEGGKPLLRIVVPYKLVDDKVDETV